jgi:uncharacterized membrane protein HdeD (DUF308 family)
MAIDSPSPRTTAPLRDAVPLLRHLTPMTAGRPEDSSVSDEVGPFVRDNPFAMESERSGATRETNTTRETHAVPGLAFTGLAFSRGMGIALGAITLILGLVIAFHPTTSLATIAVLLGVVMMVSGVFHIARAIGGHENERVWRGVSGLLFFLVGLALIRHLNLSVALIGFFVGITWIIQGITVLVESLAPGRERRETGWSVFFGVISLIAGIVVVASPVSSVTALTVLLGIWFVVMGILEIIGSLIAKPAVIAQDSGGVSVPQQRADALVDERSTQRQTTAREE